MMQITTKEGDSMHNILLLTIQQKPVLDILQSHKTYFNSGKYTKENHLIAFKELMTKYHYNAYPIFACVMGLYGNCFGIPDNCTDLYLLELQVPNNYIKYQNYYDWTDFIYFTEFPDEWNDVSPTITMEQFKHQVLFEYKTKPDIPDSKNPCPIQAVIPYISPNWLKKYTPLPKSYNKTHNGNINRIMPLQYYLKQERSLL